MSVDEPNDDETGNKRVTDSEGTVDEKVKNRILKARERVDEREDLLFVQMPADPNSRLSRREATAAWNTTVRQYIRAIEPLLKSDEIQEAGYYYREVPLGREEIPPPDGQKQWSAFARSTSESQLKREMGLQPSFDPPEAKEVAFAGLKDILDKQQISLGWEFAPDPTQWGPEQEMERLSVTLPVPKHVLEGAVSAADQFLQEAGVGLEIGHQEQDAEDDDPF
jgi:hypothetical protein